jgi:hypothetical protein
VTVRWIEPTVATKLRGEFGIGKADVGLWAQYAVLFTPEDDGAVLLGMWFPDEPERDETTYEKIARFVEAIVRESADLADVAPRLELVDRELASEWEAYVDPPAREDRGVGEFLTTTLEDRHFVLDAAAGIGSDSVYLFRRGIEVYANEVDNLLAEQAKAYAVRHRYDLQFLSLLWETLPNSLPGNLRFEAILCLGNSLCLVESATGRRQCLTAFREALLEDGLLVIDERNFQWILDCARDLNSNPLAFPPAVNGDIMYRGMAIRGYPAEIDRDRQTARWRFFRNSASIRTRADVEDNRLGCPDLLLYPFTYGELHKLLEEAGFGNIRVYADLQLASDGEGMPDQGVVGEAGFITYVAEAVGLSANGHAAMNASLNTATPAEPGA